MRLLISCLLTMVGTLGAYAKNSSWQPDLTRQQTYTLHRESSTDPTGRNADFRVVAPGATQTVLDVDGPGVISHIWVTIADPEPYHLKKIVLRMYWDGESTPSVETPIGDFFGLGLGTYTTFTSKLIVVAPDQALNSYFPMPFARQGRITVTNEGSKEVSDYYWNIDWVRRPSLPANMAYLHAQYRQCTPCQGWYHGNFYGNDFSEARKDPRWQNKTGEGNYVFLEAQGDGQFVGVTLSVFQNQWGGWNEGDEMIWIDGETEPRIHGTGGEDYFNGAWGF